MKLSLSSFIITFFLFSFILSKPDACFSQKKRLSFRDSLDHAFDVSDWLIDAHGFIPVPYIITEPSLGNFGLAIAPVFLSPKTPYIDSIGGKKRITPVPPDITGGAIFYTLNNTWGAILARSGTWKKKRIKYRLVGGYANVNMDYYRNIPNIGEQTFEFNFKTIPFYGYALKQFRNPHWNAGLQYLFLYTKVKYAGPLPDFVNPDDITSTVSSIGPVFEFDNRDNIFTPNKGFKAHIDTYWSDEIIGSDYSYGRINYFIYAYKTMGSNLIGGLRLDGQQAFGNTPFYLLPYIDMRGIPANRYQGKGDILTEAELRWDFQKRWSLMAFGGTGKAFNSWSDFGDATWAYSFGTGFRYLMARKFGLRMGIDIARGPEKWAYYIVFGSSWLK
ncbi:BamA/TamA family outer membrane protein [Solitalea canadensis]|uniref:Outer membrane protein/protective antigen OMA87 n=1 Tax=Solitalea canadensis (strain ATCC 29591 / DSM 3403 / JCM 21819 / LMG 8368 / NBRC 15130 / NCIMB 12057 / USAM 9D) TaxID=929556 RepID=H8KSX4_SOLCM|nr:membrane protein [Solitalea canadensis]AFD05434.1 outer membrane protein/protective antigen OMA87 [Solitalea canadensis DSM 3403]